MVLKHFPTEDKGPIITKYAQIALNAQEEFWELKLKWG